MFVSSELAASIEAAEATFLADIIAGAQLRRPELDAWSECIAGGCAGYAGPDVPVNKISGLGFGGVPDAEQLAAIEARYQERDAAVVAEVATYADPEIFAVLGERGYRLTAFEDVVGIALPAVEGARADAVQLETVATGDVREPWFECLIEGFSVPDTQGVVSAEDFPRDLVLEIMRDLASVEDLTAYLARLDGEIAGGGALRTHGKIAHLCGASTLPAFRRRGVQTTLVTERLRAAASAGSEIAVTVTQPGSKSQENMMRQGFSSLFSRAVMVLAK
ncbi:MAG: ribosomal protein S18 acetylase RimI-like enzyme [Hyphomicrobiaceae bacterium]|jgi:ribosomal protein S18 acetylase RimI-like enzyme